MPGRKGVKSSVRTADIDIEPEDLLDDDPIGIVRIPSQNIRFVESSNENPTTESNDLVALKDYFETKFNALEAKITNDAQAVSTDLDEKFNSYINTMVEDNELKNHKLEQTLKQKLKKEVSLSFRNKGNKQQYEFNLEQLAKLEEAKSLLEIGSVRILTKKIDEVISDIQKCNKLIRPADRSAGGWMTVQEYMPDELASDSDDSRKMRRAENRATKKRKLAFSKKPSSTFSSATQFHQFNSGNATQETSFGMPPSQAKDKDGTHYSQITSGDFKTPLTTVTTVENLAIGNTAAPKRTLSSKLEVNSNKTDKTDTDIKNKCFNLFDWLRSDQVVEENYFDEKEYSVKSNCCANPQVSVKGRLKTHLHYWENLIGANGVVTSVIKEGYKIPFTYTPQKAYFKNNKSALRNSDFVTDSIKDLLVNKLLKETNNIPLAVSPLSVAENSAGKKRLTLDLRYVNKHIYTHKVKFDDWKCFQNLLNAGSKFMFKFDLESGYHHIDINETFQTYVGFSWEIDGKVRHFLFTVLPFGLNSAPIFVYKDCPSFSKILA